MSSDQADDLLQQLSLKADILNNTTGIFTEQTLTKEQEAYKRYADDISEDKSKHVFQFPRDKTYKQANPADLFKVQKPENHMENLIRSKSFLADKFFPPFDLKESNLRELFADSKIY